MVINGSSKKRVEDGMVFNVNVNVYCPICPYSPLSPLYVFVSVASSPLLIN